MDFLGGIDPEERKQNPKKGGKDKQNNKKARRAQKGIVEEQKTNTEDVFNNPEKIYFVKAGTFAGNE